MAYIDRVDAVTYSKKVEKKYYILIILHTFTRVFEEKI